MGIMASQASETFTNLRDSILFRILYKQNFYALQHVHNKDLTHQAFAGIEPRLAVRHGSSWKASFL
jgi:hypothetical protein